MYAIKHTAALVSPPSASRWPCFGALQNNLANIDFSFVMLGVMTIADDIDSQLSQATSSYFAESSVDALPA